MEYVTGKGGEPMKLGCPYLHGDYRSSCKVDKAVYIPSIGELDEYCKNRRHIQCPFYCIVDDEKKTVKTREESSESS